MRKITADIHDLKGPHNRFYAKCIGAGRAGELMRYVPMKQLAQMQEECPFEYIRFHGLFHEEMNLVNRDKDGKLTFCFQYYDLLFDALLEHHIRPIVELGLMPDIMAKEEAYVFWWKMNKSMPKDLDEWSQLIEAVVRHFTYRYGEEEVKKWYFEVWNEPNHGGFFTESKNPEAYYMLYDRAAAAVKKVNPEYKVGGPATAGVLWIQETIEHCKQNNVPIDFISCHEYGVKGDFDPDGQAVTVLRDIDHIARNVTRAGKLCHEEGLEFLITEWSSSYSSRDAVHDSYFNAPYILHTIKHVNGHADMLSYWVFTDIFEEVTPPMTPFHGGFGLMNVQSIPKPAYNAYTFLHCLGDTELNCADEESFVCKSEDGVQILLWNIIQPDLTGTNNRDYFGRVLPAEELSDVPVELAGFEPDKEYEITCEMIGFKAGDAYTAYLEGNFTETPTREETAELIEKAKPDKYSLEVVADAEGRLIFTVPQTENCVDLITVKF